LTGRELADRQEKDRVRDAKRAVRDAKAAFREAKEITQEIRDARAVAVARRDQGLKGKLITTPIEVSSGSDSDSDSDIEIVATLKGDTSDSDDDVHIKVEPGLKPTEGEETVVRGDQHSDVYSSIISDLT
jgi:hypothetical protein